LGRTGAATTLGLGAFAAGGDALLEEAAGSARRRQAEGHCVEGELMRIRLYGGIVEGGDDTKNSDG
jgi:hypothetical protein